jgi:hypothetical protein
VKYVAAFGRFIVRAWRYGFAGKLGVILGAIFVLMLCSAPFGGLSQPSRVTTPTTLPVAQVQPTEAPAATRAPRPTAAPVPTDTPEPTETPRPTNTPIVLPTRNPALKAEGVPPATKDNCPDDYPIKGNIGNNGKIYHSPGSSSYGQTDPEVCFAYSADARDAGFRAP